MSSVPVTRAEWPTLALSNQMLLGDRGCASARAHVSLCVCMCMHVCLSVRVCVYA